MLNIEQYENGMGLVYKFGERFDGELSAREGINIYALHAKEHDGKVLLTMERGPRKEYRHMIKKIILTVKDGSYANPRWLYRSVNLGKRAGKHVLVRTL